MAIFDFVGTGVLLRSGVEIKLPTVRAFFRAMQVYGKEIHMVRESIRRSPTGSIRAEIVASLFVARPGDLVYVLEGLVPKESLLTDEAAQNVVLGYIALLQPHFPALDGMIGPGTDETPQDVDAASQRILRLAKSFPIDPMLIPNWPLGVFIDAWNEFSRKPDDAPVPTYQAILPTRPDVQVVGGPTRGE